MNANKKVLQQLVEKWDELNLNKDEEKDKIVANGYKFKLNGELYDQFSISQLVWLIHNYKPNSGEIPEY